MDPIAPNLGAFEQMVSHWIRIIGTGIDLFGVLIIVAGIGWSSVSFTKRRMGEQHYDAYSTMTLTRSESADPFCSDLRFWWLPTS
jgi:hypothetical protein